MSGGGDGDGPRRPRPWQAERPGAAASRQSATDELFTLVAFDVVCDKARRKVSEICKDYGLKRAQWSVFEGLMTRNRREELSARMSLLLRNAEGGGRAAVYPIGAREAEWALRVATKGMPVKAAAKTAGAAVAAVVKAVDAAAVAKAPDAVAVGAGVTRTEGEMEEGGSDG